MIQNMSNPRRASMDARRAGGEATLKFAGFPSTIDSPDFVIFQSSYVSGRGK
jgi:hypothetical protein